MPPSIAIDPASRSLVLPAHRLRHGMIYPDKWASPYVSIEFPDVVGRVALELEFWNPESPDFADNEVVVRANHRLARRETKVRAGDVRRLVLELDAAPGSGLFQLSLRSAAHFMPKLPDTRQLALVIRKFVVKAL